MLAAMIVSPLAGLYTDSIARSGKRWYISYSEVDFEVFRPAGTTRCTKRSEILHEGVPNFTKSVQR